MCSYLRGQKRRGSPNGLLWISKHLFPCLEVSHCCCTIQLALVCLDLHQLYRKSKWNLKGRLKLGRGIGDGWFHCNQYHPFPNLDLPSSSLPFLPLHAVFHPTLLPSHPCADLPALRVVNGLLVLHYGHSSLLVAVWLQKQHANFFNTCKGLCPARTLIQAAQVPLELGHSWLPCSLETLPKSSQKAHGFSQSRK